jgi:hypothetical protein
MQLPSSTLVSPPPTYVPPPPHARQSANKISSSYSCQHETIGEFDSRDSEVLVPLADLDAVGKGFMMTCSDEEGVKLVEDSIVAVGQVVDMLGVDMPLG